MEKNKKILVICGGVSTEREVSLRSGKTVYNALMHKGYTNVELFDLTRDNMGEIIKASPDVAFLALHGKGGEDGCIQGMLELAGIPYTGPGVASSAVCMNKIITKRILENVGLPTPKYSAYNLHHVENFDFLCQEIITDYGFPVVLKSPCQGSSIGMEIVREEAGLRNAIECVFELGDDLLVEQFIDGIELTLPILGNNELTIFPVIEIAYEKDFYDYETKYTSGLCHHIIPACIEKRTEKQVVEYGKIAYNVLGCCGLSRIDFIVDKTGCPMIIEVNTLPGLTDLSLFPDAARYIGMPYEDLVETILVLGSETRRDLNVKWELLEPSLN